MYTATIMPDRNLFLAYGVGAFALGIALFAATYRLSEAPAIWYDEGFYSQMAMNMASTGRQVLQVAPQTYVSSSFVTVGYPLTAPVALSYTLFGTGVLQGRAVMALFLIGCIGAAWVLMTRLYGAWTGAGTALVLATFPMLYGNGKAVLGEVPGLFFLMLTLIALMRLERSDFRSRRWYMTLGLMAGLTAAAKMFFALLVIALGLVLLARWRRTLADWRGCALGIIAGIVPLVVWIYFQFGAEASVRSVLSYYSNPYAVGNLPLHMLGNALRFATELTPAFTAVLTAVWAVSLVLRKKNERVSAVELTAFIFTLLVILSYLRLEGWYRYLFPGTVVALMYFPASLQRLTAYQRAQFPRMRPARWFAYSAVAVLAFLQFYQTAESSYIAQYYAGTRTRDISGALSRLDPERSVFLYNVPEVAVLLPGKNYFQYLDPLPNVHIGDEQLAELYEGRVDTVIVGAEFAEQHPELFSLYQTSKIVDRYAILERK